MTSLLLGDRHLRLSVQLLSRSHPRLLGSAHPRCGDLTPRIHDSLRVALKFALAERDRTRSYAELPVTALIRRQQDDYDGELGVLVHLGFYVPPEYGISGAHLAVSGPGRGEAAEAKYSSWARERKRMRPRTSTELLLSDDGDRILEGRFFSLCRKDECSYEVQAAPVRDGCFRELYGHALVLEFHFGRLHHHGQIVIFWKKAFVTSSLGSRSMLGQFRFQLHVKSCI